MKALWQIAEEKIAAEFGGRVQPGSGCFCDLRLKNDVITATVLVEVKFSKRGEYRVNRSILEALTQRAAKLGKLGVIACVFGAGKSWRAFWAYSADVLREYPGRSVLVREEGCEWKALWL